jgi:hypothetical protein
VATHRTYSRRMIHLASDGVAVRIDPRHGGEVLDLIDLRTGRPAAGTDRGPTTAELAWEGHDLHVQRRFNPSRDAVTARSTVSARRDAALVWVEHIALGLELLDPVRGGGGPRRPRL